MGGGGPGQGSRAPSRLLPQASAGQEVCAPPHLPWFQPLRRCSLLSKEEWHLSTRWCWLLPPGQPCLVLVVSPEGTPVPALAPESQSTSVVWGGRPGVIPGCPAHTSWALDLSS